MILEKIANAFQDHWRVNRLIADGKYEPRIKKAVDTHAGEYIHNRWLRRNAWSHGGELEVPFKKLPAEEQKKDIDQLRIALRFFNDGDSSYS